MSSLPGSRGSDPCSLPSLRGSSRQSAASRAESQRSQPQAPTAMPEIADDQQPVTNPVGTNLSRFLGFYNPVHDKSYVRKSTEEPETDPDLQAELLKEYKQNNKRCNHKKHWMKTYQNENVRYSAISKIKAGGS